MSEQDRYNIASTHMNLGSVLDDAGKSDEAIVDIEKPSPPAQECQRSLQSFHRLSEEEGHAVGHRRAAYCGQVLARLAHAAHYAHQSAEGFHPKAALDECMLADGITQDAKFHDECQDLQRKAR